jgi:hypothetical protein
MAKAVVRSAGCIDAMASQAQHVADRETEHGAGFPADLLQPDRFPSDDREWSAHQHCQQETHRE